MKKAAALILALCLSLALVGCSASDGKVTDSKGSSKTEDTIIDGTEDAADKVTDGVDDLVTENDASGNAGTPTA